jgi:hypothetical protein
VVAGVSSRKPKIRGVVREVGLERDENQFHSFNLKMGVVVNAGKKLSYEEGEKVMKGFRQDFLGKTVEITPSKAKKSRKAPSKKTKKAAKPRKKASGT